LPASVVVSRTKDLLALSFVTSRAQGRLRAMSADTVEWLLVMAAAAAIGVVGLAIGFSF
jgi:hypothetical protein